MSSWLRYDTGNATLIGEINGPLSFGLLIFDGLAEDRPELIGRFRSYGKRHAETAR